MAGSEASEILPVRSYGYATSHGYKYRRLRPKPGRTERTTPVRIPLTAKDALIERAASKQTQNGFGYTLSGSGKGLGKYLSGICTIWRRTGEKDTSQGDFDGLYDDRPAILRELDVYGPKYLGRDGILAAVHTYKSGQLEEDTWGMFRWNYLDEHMLADTLAAFFPVWSPYDVPRLPILQALPPPEYRADSATLLDWSNACAEFYASPVFPRSYGVRGVTKYGGVGGEAVQTTINLPVNDQNTLDDIASTYHIRDRDTLLIALAAGWLGHGRLPGGTAAETDKPSYLIY